MAHHLRLLCSKKSSKAFPLLQPVRELLKRDYKPLQRDAMINVLSSSSTMELRTASTQMLRCKQHGSVKTCRQGNAPASFLLMSCEMSWNDDTHQTACHVDFVDELKAQDAHAAPESPGPQIIIAIYAYQLM